MRIFTQREERTEEKQKRETTEEKEKMVSRLTPRCKNDMPES